MILKYRNTISGGNQNTYKFALGFAILNNYAGEPRLSFASISETIARSYYQNHVVFKLRETNNASQVPNAITIIKGYLNEQGFSPSPPRSLPVSDLRKIAKRLVDPPNNVRSYFDYVLPCWQGASRNDRGYYVYPPEGVNDFFSYSKPKKEIILSEEFAECIDQHKQILIDLTTMGWAQFLEKFNLTPNLITKLSPKKPSRRLGKFQALFRAIPELGPLNKCFLCNESIEPSDLTLDHVIPFDFVYTDELWNLVPACRSCNSKKSMKVGSDALVRRLIARNRMLYRVSVESRTNLRAWISDQFTSAEELEERLQQLRRDCINAGYSVDSTYA